MRRPPVPRLRRLLFCALLLSAGCKTAGQRIDPRPYAETAHWVEAARAARISTSLEDFCSLSEADLFRRQWRWLGWAECTYPDGFLGMHGDQSCYSGYILAGLVHRFRDAPTPGRRAHLAHALNQFRVATSVARSGFLPRAVQQADAPVHWSKKWVRAGAVNYRPDPSVGQYVGAVYGLFTAAIELENAAPELAHGAREVLRVIGDDLVVHDFFLRDDSGEPTSVPVLRFTGPSVIVPGVGHVTVARFRRHGRRVTYINLREKYNLNLLAVVHAIWIATGEPRFREAYDGLLAEGLARGLYRATFQTQANRLGKDSSHLGVAASLDLLLPHCRGPETAEYRKALRYFWAKVAFRENEFFTCVYVRCRRAIAARGEDLADLDRLGPVVTRRLRSWPTTPRPRIEVVNSNRPDLDLVHRGFWGYEAAKPLPRCEAPRKGFYPAKNPFELDAKASRRIHGAGDFILCYAYAKRLGLVGAGE